jgi:hypothetical protein
MSGANINKNDQCFPLSGYSERQDRIAQVRWYRSKNNHKTTPFRPPTPNVERHGDDGVKHYEHDHEIYEAD